MIECAASILLTPDGELCDGSLVVTLTARFNFEYGFGVQLSEASCGFCSMCSYLQLLLMIKERAGPHQHLPSREMVRESPTCHPKDSV